MREDEARQWLKDSGYVSPETWDRIALFIDLLQKEMESQNLISRASADQLWARHIVDSAQLLRFLPWDRQEEGEAKNTASGKIWLDLGSGAGFPGLIIALLTSYQVKLVESRARRIDYLNRMVESLGLAGHTQVCGSRLEQLESFPADVISARAFAPLPKLLTISARFSTEKTVWLLPKGKNAVEELKGVSPRWQKMFHVEQSVTDDTAGILVAAPGRGAEKG